MPPADEFDFSGDSVAAAYDDVLVPVLFRPWAEHLAEQYGPWNGQRVLDLATGTGVVAQLLGDRVGAGGNVIAADISPDMLSMARKRCSGASAAITFVESAAHPLDVASTSVDTVVCQQGFQFFPEPHAAIAEIHRVLRGGGRTIVSCWRDVDSCQFFGAVCETLCSMGKEGISDLMRLPFSQNGPDLKTQFENGGFVDVTLSRQDLPLVFESIDAAVDTAYSTPIGPKLRKLSDDSQAGFRRALADRLEALSDDGRTMGSMASHMLTARKDARP
jgi:SAM-dependent methyltransferase